MKKINKKLIVILSVVLTITILAVTGIMVLGETVDVTNVIELRIKNDHPGIPGYDLQLEAIVYYGAEGDTDRLSADKFTLSCDVPDVKFDGDKITIPASFKDNTDLEGLNIYVKHNEDTEVVGVYPLTIKKWSMTANDEFEGTEINNEMWSVTSTTDKKDVGGGKTWGWDKQTVTVRDGNMNISVMVNDGSGVSNADFIAGKVNSKYYQNEGLFLSSIKMPSRGGANNGFWLTPTSEGWGEAYFALVRSGTREGMYDGEMDIVEYSPNWKDKNGVPRCVITDHFWYADTLEFDKEKSYAAYYSTEKLANDYITYAVAWTPVALYYYCDGNLVKTVKNTESTDELARVTYTVLEGSYNGLVDAWAGAFTDEDIPYMTMSIDYCRWYK